MIPRTSQQVGILEGYRRHFGKFGKPLLIACCLTGLCYEVFNIVALYMSYPTVVDLQLTHPTSMELPAVTVCDKNGFLVSKFCRNFKEICEKGEEESDARPSMQYRDMPELTRREYKKLGSDPLATFRLYNTTGGGAVIDAESRSSSSGPKQLAKRRWVGVVDSEFIPNTCYAVYSLWGNAEAKPSRILRTSNLFFWLWTKEKEYFQRRVNSVGFQVAVHDPHSLVNPFTHGFSVQAGRAYHVYVKQTVKNLLGAPFTTNCFDYRTAWRDRGGKGPLSAQQCIEECMKNISIERYGCYRDFIAFDENDTYCYYAGQKESDMISCTRQCPSACNSVEYHVEIEEQGPSLGENPVTFRKSAQIWIFFSRMEVMTVTYEPKVKITDLLNHVGSSIGIWFGVYLIMYSVARFCSAFSNRCVQLRQKLRRNLKKTCAAETIENTITEPKEHSLLSDDVPLGLKGMFYWNMIESIAGIQPHKGSLYNMKNQVGLIPKDIFTTEKSMDVTPPKVYGMEEPIDVVPLQTPKTLSARSREAVYIHK